MILHPVLSALSAILLAAAFLFSLDRSLAIIMFVWYVIILAAIGSAVKGIFTVVLYRYASAGGLPNGFSGRLIDGAVGNRFRSNDNLVLGQSLCQ